MFCYMILTQQKNSQTKCQRERSNCLGLGRRASEHCIASAQDATGQIIDEQYAEPYIREQYSRVYGIGIGFGGKDCVVKSLGNLSER